VVAAFLALIRMYERDFKAKPGVETDTRA
jgi:hypothetical protein